jgi:hypothetical protein
MKQRLLNIAIAIDQLLWVVLTLGKGYPDETISAAAYRMEQQSKLAGRVLRPIIDALFWPWDRDHCRLSYESEIMGNQLPSIYRCRRDRGRPRWLCQLAAADCFVCLELMVTRID